MADDAGDLRLGGPRQRAVLAILLLDANRVVPVERIVAELYGDAPPPTAVGQVRDHVSQLRKLLANESVLETRAPGYLLRVAEDQVDAFRFETLTSQGFDALGAGDAAAAVVFLREALALWRGPALADFVEEPFAQTAAARLEALRLEALERRIEADLALGRTGQLLGELEELVSKYPLREQLREHLMLALYRSGRQAEALDLYHGTRRMLVDELGIEPSPALRELAGKMLRQEPSLEVTQPASGDEQPARIARNPYKGLRPFSEADEADFFGREEICSRFVALLGDERFVAVVGPSGCGKSSLVFAGLLPALGRGALPGSEGWSIAMMTPSERPLEELEAALLRIATNPPATLLEQLEADERGLCRAVKRVLPSDESNLLLVVDQLEELFTLSADDEHAGFLTLLEQAIVDPKSRLRVVVTLRADFYDRPLRFRGFAELLRERVLSLPPLSPEAVERAVSAPAARVGVSLEAGLLGEIVADMVDEPGALPLLQYALSELFEHRDGAVMTRSAYRTTGGVSGALATRAEQLYSELSEDEQAVTRQFFLRLVSVRDDGADTRRPVELAELASLDVDQDALSRCVAVFGPARLLSFDRDARSGRSTVVIAHEALLLAWGRLRDWIEAARDDIRTHRRLTLRAAEWQESSRDSSFLLSGSNLVHSETLAADSGLALTDGEREFLDASALARHRLLAEDASRTARERKLERHSLNRLRALVAVLAVAGLVASGLTLYAFDQSSRSQRQARIASARQLAAASLSNLDVDPELSILLGTAAVNEAHVHGAPLPDAVDALHEAISASRLVLTIRTPATAAIAVSPDGSRFAAAGSTSSSQVSDAQTGSPRGATKASVWDLKSGRRLLSLKGVTSPIDDIAYSPDGDQLVTGSTDGTAIVWNATTGKYLFRLADPGGTGGFLGVAFSTNGKRIATADRLGRIHIWNTRSHRLTRTLANDEPLCGVAWADGRSLIAAAQCGAYNFSPRSDTRVWNVDTGRLVFRTHGRPTTSHVSFARDGSELITPTLDGTADIWNVKTRRLVFILAGQTGQVHAVAFQPNGSLAATGGTDGTARIWNARNGQTDLVLHGHRATVDAVAFTPDGSRLITSGQDGTIRVWNITTGGSRDWLTLAADRTGVGTVFYNNEGTQLTTTGVCDGTAKVWNADTGALLHTYSGLAPSPDGCTGQQAGQRFQAATAATSPNGTLVASAGFNGTTELIHASTGRVIRVLPGGHGGAQAIAFDPSGRRVATGNWDGTAAVWDVRTGRRLWTFQAHTGTVESVAFDHSGTMLATGGDDTTAKIWSLRTGQQLTTLAGHTFAVTDVTFSPDDTRLATSSGDGTVRIYVLPTAQLLAVARARLTRTWTRAECRIYLPGKRCPDTRD